MKKKYFFYKQFKKNQQKTNQKKQTKTSQPMNQPRIPKQTPSWKTNWWCIPVLNMFGTNGCCKRSNSHIFPIPPPLLPHSVASSILSLEWPLWDLSTQEVFYFFFPLWYDLALLGGINLWRDQMSTLWSSRARSNIQPRIRKGSMEKSLVYPVSC